MTSYMFSYCEYTPPSLSLSQFLTAAFSDGIAAGFGLSLMNYLLLGWAASIDGFYLHSFEIWLACMVVFPGLGNLGYTLLEYRLGHRSLLASLVENLTWVPFL